MHMQPVYTGKAFYSEGDTAVSEQLFESAVCLPSGTAMSEETQDMVIDIVKGCFRAKQLKVSG